MPKFRRSPQVVTRLAPSDMERFRELAMVKGMSFSSLVRDAVLYYLDHHNQQKVNELEGIYAQQLKAMANRICALIAKNLIHSGATNEFLARVDTNGDELMKECISAAAKRLSRSSAAEGQTVASSMTNKAMKAS